MEETYTKEETKALKVGMCVAIIMALCFTVNYLTKEKVEHFEDGIYYPLKARFGRTDGLMLGDPVRLSGMTIGRVVDAHLDEHFNAVLTLDVKEGTNIPTDSSAAIVSSGIMGGKYIEIEPGGEEDFLKANDEFSYTQDAMVLEELVDRIISIGKANRSKTQLEHIENASHQLTD
ncbi:MAG: outer membrane lipid asymmetry maintenance protein MlaD [Alphaproteobacteria bacterium]|nr:outer membrane lipid asymmetry maintenance protein MlaD [Alphaproteobacteria bacterium]